MSGIASPKQAAPSRDEVLARIRRLISDQMNRPEDSIGPAESLTGDIGMDSLDVVELQMKVEEEFGLEFLEESADGVDSLDRLTDVVTAALASANGGE